MFKRAYELAQDLGNPVVTEDARIQLGIASSHLVLSGFCSTMNVVNKPNLQKLLDFKSSRAESFFGGEEDGTPEQGTNSRAEVIPDPDSQGSTAQDSGIAENEDAKAEVDDVSSKEVGEEKDETTAKEATNETTDSGATSEHEGEAKESS